MSKDNIEFNLPSIGLSGDQIKSFFKKYGLLFIVLIPVLLGGYIRLTPSDIPNADSWAQSSVESYYKNMITEQVRQQYPNLPNENIKKLVEDEYKEFYKNNKNNVEEQIELNAAEIRSHFQDENGFTYMPDIDPYTYLRYARNYLETGHVGDEIKDGVEWDNHMVAPKGKPATKGPHPIVLVYMYKIMKVFSPKITLMQSTTYFPVIFSMLSIIPIFFIARMFSGNIGGFFAGIMMAVNGAFLGRTTWGHADTDSYAIFFAVFCIWFVFLALKQTETKKILIYSGLSGLTLGIFSIFWAGWWYVFDFIAGMLVLYCLYLLVFEYKTFSWNGIKQNKELKQLLFASLMILIASIVFVCIMSSPNVFFKSITSPITFTAIKAAGHETLWPNVYTTVAELNTASIPSIINTMGGKWIFFISVLGILLLFMYRKTEDDKIDWLPFVSWILFIFAYNVLSISFAFVLFFAVVVYSLIKNPSKREYMPYAILIILWYIGIIYASTKGIRFTMMLVPPLSLAFGAVISMIYEKTQHQMQKYGISGRISGIAMLIILILLFFPYVKGTVSALKNDVPMIDDAWYESLNKIKIESEPDAIINSWWDFGHHFKYFADRAVTFDGASQNTPMAHWIGKVLLTNNEKEAVGILRMLDCGSNDAFEVLNEVIKDTPTTVEMLYDTVVLEKTAAESYLLNKGVSSEATKQVLGLTHCSPPENYFITSEDMVGKSGVWAHFGSWDFDKADIWINAANLPKEEAISYIKKRLETTDVNAKNVYFKIKSITDERDANTWIAPWPGFGETYGCAKQDNLLVCGGVKVDLNTKDTQISTSEGVKRPDSLVYVENGNVMKKEFQNGIGNSLMLIKTGTDSYNVRIVSTQIADGMFTRLFFYEGAGTSHFEKFSDKRTITGQRIIIWKVKW